MAIKWITHKDMPILYVDYQECETKAALIALLDESARMILSQPCKVRLLSNFKGTLIGAEYINWVKQTGTDISRTKLEKSAFVGIGDLTRFLVASYLRSTGDKYSKVFKTMEEALDWLAST